MMDAVSVSVCASVDEPCLCTLLCVPHVYNDRETLTSQGNCAKSEFMSGTYMLHVLFYLSLKHQTMLTCSQSVYI